MTYPAPATRSPRVGPDPALALAAAALLAGCLLGPEALFAQDEDASGPVFTIPPAVELQTSPGVNQNARPRATVALEEPAYVAVFEVEPGVGATMIWPHGDLAAAPVPAGSHTVRLNGQRVAVYRKLMLSHFGRDFIHRSPNQADAHLVAVVSRRPLDVEKLRSGRVFGYTHGSADAETVTGALFTEVVDEPLEGVWSYDRVAFMRFWDGPVREATSPLAAAPFLPVHVPLDPRLDLFRSPVVCSPLAAKEVTSIPGLLTQLGPLTGSLPSASTRCVGLNEEQAEKRREVMVASIDSVDATQRGGGPVETRPDRGADPISDEVATRLRRIADARRGADASLGDHRQIGDLAETLRARGFDVPDDLLRRTREATGPETGMTARQRIQERRRRLDRVRRARGFDAHGGLSHEVPGFGGPADLQNRGVGSARRPGVGDAAARARAAVESAGDAASGSSSGSGSGSSVESGEG